MRHLEAILRNANLFYRRWGWFPMEGWLRRSPSWGSPTSTRRRGAWVSGAASPR